MGRGEGGGMYSNYRDIIREGRRMYSNYRDIIILLNIITILFYLIYSRGGRRGCWTGEDVCAAESVTSKEWSLHESLLVIIGIILPRC